MDDEPTEAQIEAGVKALRDRWQQNGDGLSDHGYVECVLRAALTAKEPDPTEAQIEEYEILCNGEWVAGANGPGARAEILHYLTQYEQDGPCEVYAVTRRLVDRAAFAAKEPDATP